ncbi:MAG: putative beta-lactamase [Bacteroidetes bacterium HLUCCA01]|nr:MAG: putative beta-lactamase [Bacteroidetes bacterium HLUCCA01]
MVKKILLLLFIAAGFIAPVRAQSAFPQIAPLDAGFSPERLFRLQQTLDDYAKEQRNAGSVTLILRDGQQVFFHAAGSQDLEAQTPMQYDTMFRIASQTKAIISVAVMILQEEGRLLIQDPVGKYLPEFMETTVAVPDSSERGYTVVPANRPITIRDLLMHTAGIGYGYGVAADAWRQAGIQGWYLADRAVPVRELVRSMARLPMDAQPAERFVYGYANDILGALIEEVSGRPLDEYLQEALFGPLAMRDTHFFVPEEKVDRLATVYSASQQGLVRAPDPGLGAGQGHYVQGPRVTFGGGAGLVSTAQDYARFLQMMLNGGILDDVRILSPATVELMTVNHLDGIPFRPGLGIGLGFDIVTDLGVRGVPGAVGDYGWGGAYHSTYWVSPQDGLVVVFFTQLIPSTGSDIHAKLRTLLYQSLEF